MAVNDTKYSNVAAIFGVTGLVGKEIARRLLSSNCKWKVYGIARRPDYEGSCLTKPDYHFISCDLLNPAETQRKLAPVLEDVTHIFWVTWANQYPLDTYECYLQNKSMMSNTLDVILPNAKALKHVSLQTGTKHYVSIQVVPNNNSQKHNKNVYYDEHSPRAGHYNFYYALEDLLQDRLPSHGVSWSIQRPGLIIGCSIRTNYNFIGSLCVYGIICKYLNLPFVFGGTKHSWEEMSIDASDARLVSEQHIWAATSVQQKGNGPQVFNAINGEGYAWKEMWTAIGVKLGAYMPEDEEKIFSEDFKYSSAMADKGGVWKEIVKQEGLVETEMEDLANWDFLDVLFRCPVKMLCTREKADKLGFITRYNPLDSIFYWIDVMRSQKLIPPVPVMMWAEA